MTDEAAGKEPYQKNILTPEQEELLELYINSLDEYLEAIKDSERLQAKIETLHLKRILAK